MQIAEKQYGIPNNQALRESTHLLHKNGRSGKQEFFDNGFGKMKNTDFEPLHYADNWKSPFRGFSYINLLSSFFNLRMIFFSSLEI